MNKQKSLFLILTIYLATIILSFLVFNTISTNHMLLDVFITSTFATFFIFIMSTVFKNSSIYDAYWSVAPMVIILVFVDTINAVSILFVFAIYFWGIRLTRNWVLTFKDLSVQDWRYDHYRSKAKKLWPLVNFFGIHLMPTYVVLAALTPVYFALQSSSEVTLFVIFGFFISIAATMLQTISDRQMHQHLVTTPNKVINTGLWKYSRHPNYFGEIMFWVGLFVMSVSITQDIRWSFGPIVMILLFVFISVPLMEQRQIKRRPEYVDYQSTTRMLIPLPKEFNRNKREA